MPANNRAPFRREEYHAARLHGLAAAVLIVATALTACGGSDEQFAVWETVDGSQFATKIVDDESLRRLQAALADNGRAGIPNGRLQRGDGGFNHGHEWHVVDVELVDFTIELCDGTASMVDDDVDYWIDTVGQYCPWDARVVAITDDVVMPWPAS